MSQRSYNKVCVQERAAPRLSDTDLTKTLAKSLPDWASKIQQKREIRTLVLHLLWDGSRIQEEF